MSKTIVNRCKIASWIYLNPIRSGGGPRYEGQPILMTEPKSHSKHPPRTPSRPSSFFATDGPAGTDISILRGVDTVAHHFHAVCSEGSAVCSKPSSFGPKRELPPARLQTYRPTDLCQHNIGDAEGRV